MDRTKNHGQRRRGFTLIELLVVIAIIATLAALIVGIAPKAFDARKRTRVTTELEAMVTVINSYQQKLGFYPPDNPANPGQPPLYYELTGTVTKDDGVSFEDITGATLTAVQVQQAFGIPSFLNTGNDRGAVKNFHPNMAQSYVKSGTGNIKFIVASAPGPDGDFNPWNYDSHSADRHNPESYDLWADIIIGGKTNRIANWKE